MSSSSSWPLTIAIISQSNAVGSRKKEPVWHSRHVLHSWWRFFHSFPVFLKLSFLSRQYSWVTRVVLCLRGCNFFESQNKQHAYLLHVRKMQNVCFIWPIKKQITECDFEKVWKCCALTLVYTTWKLDLKNVLETIVVFS